MDLLLSHDDGKPFLDGGPSSASAARAADKVDEPTHLANLAGNASDLGEQRWAVVVEEGQEGARLAALVADLMAHRAGDQGAEVLTITVPPGLDTGQASDWKKRAYPAQYGGDEGRRPRYLLLLGDLDRVSLATQQALADDGFPGRLVCTSDDGYQRYAAKVIAAERTPSAHGQARALFYAVDDGTAATASAREGLIGPCFADCRELWQNDRKAFPAASVAEHGSGRRPDPDDFLDLVAEPHPTVLLSASHGMGPPRNRTWSASEARQRQGAMQFGSAGALLPADIAEDDFLPGGMWLYFACFGAGTPSRSAYKHWLAMLASEGMSELAPLCSALDSQAETGGFTSGIAQAALANPRGPLAILGHIDLAWSSSYRELSSDGQTSLRGTSRSRNFRELVTTLVKGERAGACWLELQRNLGIASKELNDHYDRQKELGGPAEGDSAARRLTLGNLWMLRQDLLGYALLGDPAVRLPLAPAPAAGTGDVRTSFGGGLFSAARRQPTRSPSGQKSAVISDDEHLDLVEKTILGLAAGRIDRAQAAGQLAIAPEQASRWASAYREAGRLRLRDLLAGKK